MKENILISLLVVFSLAITNCTSKNSENLEAPPAEDSLSLDGEAAPAGDAAAAADGAATPAPDAASGNLDETQAGFLDEQLTEEATPPAAAADPNALAAQDPTQTPPPADAPPADAAAGAPPADLPPPEVVAGVDPGSTEQQTPPVEATPPAADPVVAPPVVAESPKPPPAPLRKVESIPFRRNGTLLNAVYLARPGDTYAKISEKIYGDNTHAKALKKVNPSIKNPKPGDKVYYNSPVRPTDDTRIANFYEDKGIPPQSYVAKDGENLRQISKGLLGYSQAWKEVWATNSVDSKNDLSAGTELKYWPADALAAAAPPPAPEVAVAPPPPVQELPPPPPVQDLPPPPPPQTVAEVAPPPVQELPPPPPPEPVAPPPPPPPPPVAKKPPAPAGFLDNETMTLAAGAGAALAAIAALMIIRKRRAAKEMQAAFGDTQVG